MKKAILALLMVLIFAPAVYAQQADKSAETVTYGGLYLGATPNGLAISVVHDASERMTYAGELGLNNAVVTGRALYRFQSRTSGEGLSLQPYAGGGLVSFYGGTNGLGVVGSAGAFIAVKDAPSWRFSGELNWVASNIDITPVDGLGVRFGAHYRF